MKTIKEINKREAIDFIKQNPNRENYINENYKTYWNYTIDEPDDDSVQLSDEWDENYEIAKKYL